MQVMPRAAIFDLDDTLAESFQPPKPDMIERLARLLDRIPVAISTAASFSRIERQFLPVLAESPHIDRLYVFPNSSAQCFTHEGGAWKRVYDFMLSLEERARISEAILEAVDELGITAHPKYEPKIIDREVQIAYAAIGLEAPLEEKRAWDPDQAKRKLLKAAIERKLPGFEVLIGGMTTIDITREGVNKAYGVRWLAKELGVEPHEMLYVGDALYPGGNDNVVIPTGIQTMQVAGPLETQAIIDELCALDA